MKFVKEQIQMPVFTGEGFEKFLTFGEINKQN